MKKATLLAGLVTTLVSNLLFAEEPVVYEAYEEGTHYAALQIPLMK